VGVDDKVVKKMTARVHYKRMFPSLYLFIHC